MPPISNKVKLNSDLSFIVSETDLYISETNDSVIVYV